MEGWSTIPLADGCSVFTDGDWVEKKDQSPSGIRLIQTGNVGDGSFKNRLSKARYISTDTFDDLKCTEIFAGDCLVSRLPDPVGRSCIIPETGERMITAVDCSIIRFKRDTVLPEFFRYYSQSRSYLATVDGHCTGATRRRISRKNLGKVPIPLPPLPEQERIVAILDEAFAAIATATANAEKNLANARELFESYLDSFFRSPKDSWNSLLLDAVLDRITYGFTNPMPTTETGPWMVTAKNIRDGGIDYANARHTSQEAYDELLTDKSRPKVGDLLLTKDGTLGRLAVVDRNDICVNQSVAVLQKNEQVNSSFLQYLLTSPNYQELMIKDAGGTTIKHIYITRVVKMSVSLPPMKEQRALVHSFERYQAKASVLTAACQHKLELLNNLKQSLLHKAFTGELTADSKAADRSLSEANV
jgi:type I restriction enzyme, S subunit